MSGLKPRPTWERWRRQEKQRQKQIPCGNGKLEGQEQRQKTNTGVSPLRRKSAPPVEMTEFGVRLGEHTPGTKARVVVGLDVWAEAQTYLGAMAAAGEATTEADSLREWKARRARATATTKSQYGDLSTAAAKCAPSGRDDSVWGEVGRATADADSLREWKLEEQKQKLQIPAEWKTRGARATAKAKSQYRGLSTAAAKCKVLRLRSGSR